MPPDPDNLESRIPRHHRLQFRANLVVLLLLLITVGFSNWILARLIGSRLSDVMIRDTIQLADHLGDRVRAPLATADFDSLNTIVESLHTDPMIAFAVIEDPSGHAIASQVNDASCWASYLANWAMPVSEAHLALSMPVTIGDPHAIESRVYRTAVLGSRVHRSATPHDPPVDSSSGRSADRILVGFVTIGVVDSVLRSTLNSIQAIAIGVVCVVCLSAIPVTIILMQRLTRPLRRIVHATSVLAAGGNPSPLAIGRADEIGLLARSFNDMAAKLAVARAELVQANTFLERQVDQRTAELSRVNTRLHREIEDKNEFLRAVSHDLNAPLRNIAGMTAMIRRRFEKDLPGEVVDRLGRIAANVEIESSMLDDLLELSRLRSRPGQPENVDLVAVLTQIVDALSHDMAERGIEFRLTTKPPVIRVEPNLVRRVFLNLIDNAIKYMGDRPVRRISVSHAVTSSTLEITVADTGPGILEHERESVFQIFRRGSSASDNHQIPGRGVGLTSVRMVVEGWGGTIQLESTVGEGSRFIVAIPADCIVQGKNNNGVGMASTANLAHHPNSAA